MLCRVLHTPFSCPGHYLEIWIAQCWKTAQTVSCLLPFGKGHKPKALGPQATERSEQGCVRCMLGVHGISSDKANGKQMHHPSLRALKQVLTQGASELLRAAGAFGAHATILVVLTALLRH